MSKVSCIHLKTRATFQYKKSTIVKVMLIFALLLAPLLLYFSRPVFLPYLLYISLLSVTRGTLFLYLSLDPLSGGGVPFLYLLPSIFQGRPLDICVKRKPFCLPSLGILRFRLRLILLAAKNPKLVFSLPCFSSLLSSSFSFSPSSNSSSSLPNSSLYAASSCSVLCPRLTG